MTKEQALKLIETYGKAWETRDPELIVTIFTGDAVYDDPHEPTNNGLDAIKQYWITKVQGEQKDIKFKLLNLWVIDDVVVAEWNAKFTNTVFNMKYDMTETAIFKVRDDKFCSLREYYKNKKTPL